MGLLKPFLIGSIIALLAMILPRLMENRFGPPVPVCPTVPGPEGCCKEVTTEELISTSGGTEDVVVDHDTGIVFFSVADHKERVANKNFKTGFIYQYNPATGKIFSVPLENHNPENFHPHGMSLLVEYGKDGDIRERFLFVVNHSKDGDSVIRFRILGDLQAGDTFMRQLEVVSDPAFISLNDVVAVDALSFYVTNDHGTNNPIKSLFIDLAKMPSGNVVYYSARESNTRIAIDNMVYPNGINISRDRKYLYVAELLTGTLHVYERLPDGSHVKVDSREMNSSLDNIDVDPVTGNLFIGSHPSLWGFLRHTADPSKYSPSQVFVCTMSDDGGKVQDHSVVLSHDGSIMSALSIAVPSHASGRMIGGAVHQSKILDCPLPLQPSV